MDDTLLWDEKASEQHSGKHVYKRKKYGLDPHTFEEAVRKAARELYMSYETYPYTVMIGINPFEGLWANFSEPVSEGFKS